jgi:tRNA nucleotidyltransferase/poly(A) polymerase
VLGHEVKDVDIVVEPQEGRDAATLGNEIAGRLGLKCYPDQYGVVHIGPVQEPYSHQGVSLLGQKVEIVTARKEKYDRSRKKDSHKPSQVAVGTIREDLERRDFTINTLMWRLADLSNGPEGAPVIDLLGGLADLRRCFLRTPLDPYETFDDDPSRMLRAVRFAVKYSLEIEGNVYRAIQELADQLHRLPYEAIDPLFFDKILTMPSDQVRKALMLMDHTRLLPHVRAMIPSARMRRAIQERIKDVRLLLILADWGLDVGIRFNGKQLQHLLDASNLMSDDKLAELFRRFKTPLDTERYIQASGAKGSEIGRAVERARDLVLLGLDPDQVFAATLESEKTFSV